MKRLTFIILCLEGAVLSFNVAATAALVPSIAKEFALSQFFVGKIVWLYMLPYGAAALFYGPLVKAIDAKKVEITCLFLFSCANMLAALSGNIYALFTARLFMGLFGASVIPLGIILIARHTEANKRGQKVGIFFSATFFASLLGLSISGVIPWRLIYLFPAIAGYALCLLMYFCLPSFKGLKEEFSINYIRALKSRRVLSIFTYIFFISLIYHGIQQWLAVYFSSSFNFNQATISMLITLTSLSGIFGEIVGGRFADVLGRLKTVDTGLILMILSLVVLMGKFSIPVFALMMLVWGFGWTFNHSGLSTMLTDLPNEFLNESASLNSSIRFIAGGIGVAVAGVVMQKSFSIGFMFFAVGLSILFLCAKPLLKS